MFRFCDLVYAVLSRAVLNEVWSKPARTRTETIRTTASNSDMLGDVGASYTQLDDLVNPRLVRSGSPQGAILGCPSPVCPQPPTAFLTRAVMRAISAGPRALIAYAVGQRSPSSSAAWSLNPSAE